MIKMARLILIVNEEIRLIEDRFDDVQERFKTEFGVLDWSSIPRKVHSDEQKKFLAESMGFLSSIAYYDLISSGRSKVTGDRIGQLNYQMRQWAGHYDIPAPDDCSSLMLD